METDIPTNAPQSCPGTSSLAAGKANGCAGCPNQKLCASGAGGEIDSVITDKIANRLENVKNIILVMSGKGGVGKSSVTSCLAYALNACREEKRVAVLDIDITGPSIPTMLGCSDQQVHKSASGWSPVYVNENLSVMSVGFLLSDPDQAIIWRGPKKNQLIEQMLTDVNWTEHDDEAPIDYLLVDTPPGTSDEHMSIVKYLKAAGLLGRTRAVVVSTPQEVALADVRKQLGFCGKVGLQVMGAVGNMTSCRCSHCDFRFPVFPSTGGGIEQLCDEYKLRLLANLPVDSGLTWCLDNGVSLYDGPSGTDTVTDSAAIWPLGDTVTAIELMVGNLLACLD